MVGQINKVGIRYGWTLEMGALNFLDDRSCQAITGHKAGAAPGHVGEEFAARLVNERHGTQVHNVRIAGRLRGVGSHPRDFLDPWADQLAFQL